MFSLINTSFKLKNTVRTILAGVDGGEFNLIHRLLASGFSRFPRHLPDDQSGILSLLGFGIKI